MADVAAKTKTGEEIAPAKDNVEKEEPVAEVTKPDADGDSNGDADADAAAEKSENGAEGSADDDDELSKFERKIIRQVEYYFGDANLNRDKFLVAEIAKDTEGWVPFSVLLTFKRLASLSTDAKVIAEALLKSDEGLLEISEDKQKIRRHPERPIPEHNEERRKDIMSRTAYVKGFPLDADIAEVIEFFSPYEKVANITMRKYLDKPTKTYKFKGSVFVTFEKKEQTKEFIEKDKVVYKERELIRKWQDKYLEEKREEMKSKSKKSKNKAKQQESDKFELPKGAVVFFEGATEVVTRELVREAIEKMKGNWEIAFIEYSKGNKDGHIRFEEENIAAKFIEKLEGNKLKLSNDLELAVRTLTDDEEKTFLDKVIEHMKNRRKVHHKHKGGNRNKRRGDGEGNRHYAKKQRTDDD